MTLCRHQGINLAINIIIHSSLCALLLSAFSAFSPLNASGGGGGGGGGGGIRSGGGGGSKTKVDPVYQLGQQVYNQRIKLADFNAQSFERHIRGLTEATSWSVDNRQQRAPNFFALAGRLTDKQYDGLRQYLEKRHKATIPQKKADPDYAFATRWIWQPGVSYKTTDPRQKIDKKTTSKSSAQVETTNAEAAKTTEDSQAWSLTDSNQLVLLHRLTDALLTAKDHPNLARSRNKGQDHLAQVGRLSEQQSKALADYLQQRFSISITPLDETSAPLYHLADQLISGSKEATIARTSLVEASVERAQRTFLRKLDRLLPPRSENIVRWAGRLQPQDYEALVTYAKHRYALLPED